MQFSSAFLITALSALVSAQNSFNIPPSGLTFKAGQPGTITWTPSTQGTVTLIVRQGDPKALNPGSVIAKSIPNDGKFTWTPDASIVKGSDFAIEIVSDADPKQINYTPQFAVDSSNTVSSSASKPTTYSQPPTSTGVSSNSASTTGSVSTSRATSGATSMSSTMATSASSTSSGSSTAAAATTRSTGAAATMGAKAAGALVAAFGVMVAL